MGKLNAFPKMGIRTTVLYELHIKTAVKTQTKVVVVILI